MIGNFINFPILWVPKSQSREFSFETPLNGFSVNVTAREIDPLLSETPSVFELTVNGRPLARFSNVNAEAGSIFVQSERLDLLDRDMHCLIANFSKAHNEFMRKNLAHGEPSVLKILRHARNTLIEQVDVPIYCGAEFGGDTTRQAYRVRLTSEDYLQATYFVSFMDAEEYFDLLVKHKSTGLNKEEINRFVEIIQTRFDLLNRGPNNLTFLELVRE